MANTHLSISPAYTVFDQAHSFNLPWKPVVLGGMRSFSKGPQVDVKLADLPIFIPGMDSLAHLIGINKWKTASSWHFDDGIYFLTNGFGALHVSPSNELNIYTSTDKAGWERIGWLLYYALGISVVLRRLNRLILHGNVIAKNGRACIILGESGAGKSTLTASMIRYCGWKLLSDDLAVVHNGTGGSFAVPGVPLLKLTASNLQSLFHLDPLDYTPVGFDGVKVYVPDHQLNPQLDKQTVPDDEYILSDIIIIHPEKPDGSLTLQELNSIHAVAALSYHLYNPWSLAQNELEGQMKQIFRLIQHQVKIHILHYPRNIYKIEEMTLQLQTMLSETVANRSLSQL